MDKSILNDYIDACELVKETEEDIRRLERKRKTMVQDSVKGSMQEFPYALQHHHLEGLAYSEVQNPGRLDEEELLLVARKDSAADIKVQVEAWLNTVPRRMQRIIRYKVFQRLSWEETASRMGRGATADSVRMEFDRFMAGK